LNQTATRLRASMRPRATTRALGAAVAAAGLALVTGCAGSAGAGDGGGGEGVEFGAGDEAFQAALADMEPVELTFQAGAQSGADHTGQREQAFADAIEEKSGGKITVSTVFAQPIAGFDQVTEAVSDGRIDIGLEIPIYTPADYPAITSLINVAPTAPADAYFNEMVTTAAAQEVAWSTEEILDDFRDKGVDVLVPLEFEYSSALMCTEPVRSLDDFTGKQLRVASASDFAIAEGLGASPVSMQYVETYEALQRNTIDCTFGALKIATGSGFFEVAPHVTFPSDSSFARNPTSVLTGQKVAGLPLAAQQLIFDQTLEYFTGHHEAKMKYNSEAMADIEEYGGDVYRLEDDAEQALTEVLDGLAAETRDSGALDGEKLISDFEAAREKWTEIAEEEGFAPAEDYKGFAAEFEADPISVDAFAQRVFEDVYMAHRPS
jgi:TRAP-type C4-dicarboxylate transport system substrate-binding protein